MRNKPRTRRQFLLQGGFALGGLAAAAQLPRRNWPRDSVFTGHAGALPAAPASSKRLRGVMVDAGRVPESLAYYRRVIDFCAEWGLNALQFRLADDQGCAVRFSSAPDLLFHRNAFAPQQLKELAHYGRSRGVDLIPELESFGHTGYITRSAGYAHLLDADSQLDSDFTGVIPVHPETLQLFGKLYREISDIFPSVYLHGGCDEVNWGGSALSRKALQTKQRYEIWAEYLNSLNRLAAGLGKQFIVWGDMVLRKEPRILGGLSKDIIIMDWNYTEKDSAKIQHALSTVRSNGSPGIGAPALINYRWGPRAGSDQLANIDAFTDAYLASDDPCSMGVILTNWVPSRYVQNSIWDGFAYAAVGFKEGSAIARQSAFRRFVEHHYGAAWNSTWEDAFRLIYEAAPQVERRAAAAGTVPLHIPWSSDEQLRALLDDRSPRANPFTRLRSLLDQLRKEVSKNLVDFQACALSVTYLDHLYWREAIVAGKPLAREDAALLIKQIAERDRTLAEALSRDWDQGRFSDSPAKSRPLFGLQPKDQLVFQFQRAADYSAALAAQPDRFFRIVAVSKQPESRQE